MLQLREGAETSRSGSFVNSCYPIEASALMMVFIAFLLATWRSYL